MNQYMSNSYPPWQYSGGAYQTTYPYIQPPNVQPQTAVNLPVFQQRGINGMIVQSIDNITADSVPMDGSIAVFPKQDLSEIYVKNWNADGTIRTLTFKPVVQDENKETVETDISAILDEKFSELTNKLNRLENSINKLKSRNYRKENDNV